MRTRKPGWPGIAWKRGGARLRWDRCRGPNRPRGTRALEAQLAAAQCRRRGRTDAAAAKVATESAQGRRGGNAAAGDRRLAAFDGAQLSETRAALEHRRDYLLAPVLRNQCGSSPAHGGASDGWRTGAAAQQLGLAAAAAGALASAAAQAERSLKAAQLACADSVEDLRANLADDQPCPVCGSAEHPYQHQNAQLHAMLASLQAQLDSCRTQAADNLSQQATARALLAAGAAQAATLARERDALGQTAARLEAEWAADPLAADAPAEALRGAWFAAELAALKERAQQLDAQEKAARSAAQARDLAQQTCDQAARRHAQLLDAAASARAALASAHATRSALADRHAQSGATLAALLDELDGAFDGDWRAQWHAAPAPFRAARSGEALQWAEQSQSQGARAGALGKLDAEHAAALSRMDQASRIAASAQAGFARVDADVAARRLERGALWEGRTVNEVENALAGPSTRRSRRGRAAGGQSRRAWPNQGARRWPTTAIGRSGGRCGLA
jgi:exonuclease SbcC